MKTLLLPFSIIMLSISCFGQHRDDKELFRRLTTDILRKQEQSGAAQKSTGLKQRLVLSTLYNADLPNNGDSVAYYYSNNRSNYMTPDLFESYEDYFEPTMRLLPNLMTRASYLQEDSFVLVWHPAGNRWLATGSYTYDQNGKPTQLRNRVITGGSGQSRYEITYDAAGNQVEARLFTDENNTGIFSLRQENLSYYTGGKLTVDSITDFAQHDSSKVLYSYSGNNLARVDIEEKIIGIYTPWVSYTYTYDANGRLVNALYQFAGSQWSSARRDTMVYDGNHTAIKYMQSDIGDAATTSWLPDQSVLYHFNSAGLRDTATYSYRVNNVFAERGFEAIQYNNYNNLMHRLVQDTTNNQNLVYDYFYEEYEPTNVGAVAVQKSLAIFPNPAFNKIVVRTPDIAADGTISIHDIIGHLKLTTKISAEQSTIDISTLPVGFYMVDYKDAWHHMIGNFIKR